MKICNGKECKYYNDTNYVSVFENIVKPYCRLTNEFLVVDWNNQIVLSKNDKCISDDNTNTLKNNESEKNYLMFKINERFLRDFNNNISLKNFYIGELVNKNKCNFYFELKDTNELLIIPHYYIEYMIPIKTKN